MAKFRQIPTSLIAARDRLAEANGRISQADSFVGDRDFDYYIIESNKRLAESIEAILDWLDEQEASNT